MGYIIKDVKEGIGTITFNKPEVHNAFDDEAALEWHDALVWATENKDIRILILRGEGKSFHTGRDTRAMGVRDPGVSHWDFLKQGQKKIGMLVNMDKPTIAAVKGGTIGGGAEIALACDMRVSSTDLKLSLPEVKYSLAVDQGGSAMLTSLIGPSKAKWMLMSGDSVDAQTALDWGLVDFVVQPEELDNKVYEMAGKIAKNPRQAVLCARELVNELWADGVRSAIRREYINQIALYSSEEFLELRAKRQAALKAKD